MDSPLEKRGNDENSLPMKLRIIKKILLFGFIFFLGFITHALFFPDMLVNVFTDVSAIAVPNTSPTPAVDVNSSFMTTITYNNKHFSRHSLVIPTASYVIIENLSTTDRMWLLSNNPPPPPGNSSVAIPIRKKSGPRLG